ncbi:unnamed protein product [Eruca vesicaria subsp. sativa]|uniref:Uncharacterized protein n=1 Tax=Eruca vesicaria subsp. sativa TaxID=29727 RepID=A0ABC8LBF5_ERUVS|nr:unnamed protein product [Eruca vesicaria subsp. sativa]
MFSLLRAMMLTRTKRRREDCEDGVKKMVKVEDKEEEDATNDLVGKTTLKVQYEAFDYESVGETC